MWQTLVQWVDEMPLSTFVALVSSIVLLIAVAIVLLARPEQESRDTWPTREGGFRW